MGIITALALLLPLMTVTAAVEGIHSTIQRYREAREWKAIRAVHYPRYM